MLQRFSYSVSDVFPLARHVSGLLLEAPVASPVMSYQAGQYIKVIHPDGSESPLSIAALPANLQRIELHLSHAPGNHSAQEILAMVKTERALTFTGAYGVCTVLRFAVDKPLIFFVRGTGFAPVKAMLEAMALCHDRRALHLYWGVATPDDFYLLDLIHGWEKHFANFRFTPKVSRSADQHQLHHAVLHDYPDLSHVDVYASGGMEMVVSALEVFQRHGLERERFYSDVLS